MAEAASLPHGLPEELSLVFARGLAQIRSENDVPAEFPAEALRCAERVAVQPLSAEHVDRTDLAFVTLDPASSTDLDQAFTIETAQGGDLVLRYAIADVPWFVHSGDALDTQAWARGVTTYMPDHRAALYPTALSEGAASLLPDGPRRAVIFVVRVSSDGAVQLDGVERAVIRSRAKLAYETAASADLPDAFSDFGARIAAAEDDRGASRVETPEQQIERDGVSGYRVVFRPRLLNETNNAAMSLATNMAVADALYAARTGLFRVMPEPDERSVSRLRFTAKALGLHWPDSVNLRGFERGLDQGQSNAAAFLLAVRRATGGAAYARYEPNVVPWHAAMAAIYCHGTAPLRRLGDRFVVAAALSVANGKSVPDDVQAAFVRLPEVMDRAEARASRVERSAIDLIEAIVLQGREGQSFDAVVTDHDERGARIQLCEPAVVARVSAHGVGPGDAIRVRLVSSDPIKREVKFERVS